MDPLELESWYNDAFDADDDFLAPDEVATPPITQKHIIEYLARHSREMKLAYSSSGLVRKTTSP